MSRSKKDLTHSAYTIEDGHGGMKRNRDDSLFGRGMDVFTWASQDIMRSQSPENRRRRSLDRTTRTTQRDVQQDAEKKINQRSTPPPTGMDGGGGLGGGAPMVVGGGGAGAGGGRLKRGTVIVSDLE